MTRLAVGGIWHETNTFVPEETSLEDFKAYQWASGEKLVERYRGTGTELGGVFAECEEKGFDLAPTLFAAAVPSGVVVEAAYEQIVDQMTRTLAAAGSVDAAVLALHGAMVAQGHPDAELDIVRSVRAIVGGIPLAVTLDLHANPSEELAREATLVIGYDTFPHVDMADRGREAVRLLARILDGENAPEVGFVKLPLLTVPQVQSTDEEPMRSAMAALAHLEQTDHRVWTGTISAGYPYSDVARLGVSVYVAADANAPSLARSLAARLWSDRGAFLPKLQEPMESVERALRAARGPVVLVDVADNVGGGSPGDGTVLLAALEAKKGDGVVVIWDPIAVSETYTTSQDRISLEVGGRATNDLGKPLLVEGTVSRLGEVVYRRPGPYMAGQEVPLGRVAVLTSDAGPTVVLTENRVMPFDDGHLRAVGIEPTGHQILVAKSATAWKAAFGGYATDAYYVRTPGYCPSDLTQLPYTARPAPMFPLEEDAVWTY
jgi:microcystin degradation protein MlrC